MGRKRKKDKWSNEEIFWLVLIFPIALVCAYPILLVPIIIGVVLWLVHNIIKLVERIKSNKIVKKLQKEYSLKAVVERANKESSTTKKDVSKKVISDKANDNTNTNTNTNTNSFNEILSICNDIEDKLLELDVIYFDVAEENVELNSMFSELEEYNKIIRDFRNKKLVELNDELLKEARECHKRFLELYNEFNLLVEEESLSNDVDGSEEVIEEDDVSDSLAAGAVGYSLYKKRQEEKEEKEREEYREELRNVWGLTEYQIGLVESGEYEPGQFSEEELEEDDYYSEDV